MKIFCQQSELFDALNTATHALSAKAPIQALECVYIRPEGQTVELICSDLHMTVKSRILASFEGLKTSVLLPGKLFTDIVRKLPEGDMTLDVSTTFSVKITAQQSRTTLQGIDASGYPQLPVLEDGAQKVTIHEATFKDMVRGTAFAVATDESRPILTGVFMEFEGDHVNMVGLDGFRLAMRRGFAQAPAPMNALVPGRYLSEVCKLLPGGDETLTLSFGANHLYMNLGSTDIFIRLLEGEYIKYRQIIPQNPPISVKISHRALEECVERASLIAYEGKTNLIRMNIEDDRMIITSNNESGDVYESIEAAHFGSPINISFNVRYVADMLKAIDDDELMMLFSTPVSPCTVKPVSDESFLYLILPVRTH